jgi:hypothetical protein
VRQPTDVCTVTEVRGAVQHRSAIDVRDELLLRESIGIIDEVVFPRLRALGIRESALHASAMRAARLVQFGRDYDGSLAALLGVERTGVNGTCARRGAS